MLILGIETASTQAGCAVGGPDGVLATVEINRGQRHAELLVPAVDFACRCARIELREIEAIAVDVGPGLFTGLRVGVATAKAMAQALAIPLIAVCSLDIVAFGVRSSRRDVVVALDARRGEVFHGGYRPSPAEISRWSEPAVASPAQLASVLAGRDQELLVVGDGALRYHEIFAKLGGVELAGREKAHPSAAGLVELAVRAALQRTFVSPEELTPMYLRQPDAEANWAERDTVGPGGQA